MDNFSTLWNQHSKQQHQHIHNVIRSIRHKKKTKKDKIDAIVNQVNFMTLLNNAGYDLGGFQPKRSPAVSSQFLQTFKKRDIDSIFRDLHVPRSKSTRSGLAHIQNAFNTLEYYEFTSQTVDASPSASPPSSVSGSPPPSKKKSSANPKDNTVKIIRPRKKSKKLPTLSLPSLADDTNNNASDNASVDSENGAVDTSNLVRKRRFENVHSIAEGYSNYTPGVSDRAFYRNADDPDSDDDDIDNNANSEKLKQKSGSHGAKSYVQASKKPSKQLSKHSEKERIKKLRREGVIITDGGFTRDHLSLEQRALFDKQGSNLKKKKMLERIERDKRQLKIKTSLASFSGSSWM